MKTMEIRDKHLKLDQKKIERAKAILKAKTETETIEKALEFVIAKDLDTLRRKGIVRRIINRRRRLSIVEGDVTDWIEEGRRERDKTYAG